MDTIRVAERAQRALRVARNEATRQGSAAVTPEHLLLGVIDDGAGVAGPGVVTGVLQRLGATKEVLSDALRAIPLAHEAGPEGEGLKHSDELVEALRIATEEARSLHHDWVGAEHLLLGVVQTSTPASAICARHGLHAAAVRSAITELLGPPGDSR